MPNGKAAPKRLKLTHSLAETALGRFFTLGQLRRLVESASGNEENFEGLRRHLHEKLTAYTFARPYLHTDNPANDYWRHSIFGDPPALPNAIAKFIINLTKGWGPSNLIQVDDDETTNQQ